jgi:hypothetical protein
MDHPAVARGAVTEGQGGGQGRTGRGRERLVVERNRRGERGEMLAEIGDGTEPGDTGEHQEQYGD